jgi:hypothetical protein
LKFSFLLSSFVFFKFLVLLLLLEGLSVVDENMKKLLEDIGIIIIL